MIDLRSDTVTLPSAEMRQASFDAPLGDDTYGEDPTVNELEALAARMTGKEAALFAPSGTQTNLLALISHCERGDEYIAGQDAHAYKYEGGGAAALGGIQPQPLDYNSRGELDLQQVRDAVKEDDIHFARTRLVCLENTQAGRVLSLDYLAEYSAMADELGLAKHLDGARLFNASVKLGVNAEEICQHFDSVSICLSKGLGAPVGSVLVGDAVLIKKARRWRKTLGGGMRQAGVIAAACIYALQNNVERLADDHGNAMLLAEGLKDINGFKFLEEPQTNIVRLDMEPEFFSKLSARLAENGVVANSQRWVCHLDVSTDDIDRVVELCRTFEP
jgi:threonine aldolase